MKEKDNWKVDNWQVSRAESWLPLVMRVWRDAAQACMGGGRWGARRNMMRLGNGSRGVNTLRHMEACEKEKN